MKYDQNNRDFSRIPADMRQARRWVCWAEDKTPINPATGRGAGSTNPATWATFDAACNFVGHAATWTDKGGAKQTGPAVGIGFVLGDGWAGVDLDGGDSHGGGTVPAAILGDFVQTLGTYCEYSKSGAGYHLIGRYTGGKLTPAQLPQALRGKGLPGECIEIYTAGRYFAITGNVYGDGAPVAVITDTLPRLHHRYIAAPVLAEQERQERARASTATRFINDDDRAEFLRLNMRDMLAAIPADDRDTWIAVGMALKAEGFSEADFDEWSRTSAKYAGLGDVRKRWNSFRRDGYNGGKIIALAQANGWRPRYHTGEYQRPTAAQDFAPRGTDAPPAGAPTAAAAEGRGIAQGQLQAPTGATEAATEAAEDPRAEYEASSAAGMIDAFGEYLESAANTPAIPTGFPGLDTHLDGGLYEGLYVIGAISSLGKTTFALQIIDQIARSGRDCIVFSLEMSRFELMAKSISRATYQQNGKRLAKTTRGILARQRWANYNAAELRAIASAVKSYAEGAARHTWIKEGIGDIGAAQVRGEVAKHITMTGRRPVVLIDYLQILAPADVRASDKQNTDKAVLELKRLSRDLKVPVIAISSFNRDNYSAPVNTASFKESGAIEYSADVLIGLQYHGMDRQQKGVSKNGRPVYEGDNDPERLARIADLMRENEKAAAAGGAVAIDVKILKNRNGAKGTAEPMTFVPMFNYFAEEPEAGDDQRRPAARV